MSSQTENLSVFRKRCRGTVLVVVIWIVLILASLVIVLSHFIRTEAAAASNYTSLVKAEAIANGAIQYVFALLNEQQSQSSDTSDLYEAMKVGDGYFWILRPNLSEAQQYEYGLVDEAGKININEASLEMLLKLPSMTSELANSIIDWKDENEEVTTGGAENEYYLLLPEPYQCKNAPLETLEEVLLIKGGSADLLYGEDTNRNGMLDWNENDGESAPPSDNSNGRLEAGFFNYATIHSYETNTSGGDSGRINVSDNRNRGRLTDLLTEEFGEEKALQIMAPMNLRRFRSLIEFYYFIDMEYDDFAQIIDRLTVTENVRIDGRVNINTASEEVLLCLPGLEQKDVDALIQKRSKEDELENVLWITKVLDQEKAEAIGSYITAHSYQYSADIVTVSADGRAFCRYYVVIDMAQGKPDLIYKQSLNQFGWPLDPDILTTLRNGEEL